MTTTFRNKKGQHIFYRNWKPDANSKAIVLMIHGFNSHSGYFRNVAIQLNDINVDVYAMDLEGRGQSEGERYYISDFTDIISDIDQVLGIAKSANPSLPVFLFAHSAGSVFASAYVVEHQHKLKGFISEDIAFVLPAPRFAQATIKLLGYIIPHVRVVKLNNKDFSRDLSIVDTMNNDPLIVNEKQPAKTIQQLIRAGDYLKMKIPEIKLPLLILHGTADKVARAAGSQYIMDHAASNDKQLKLYEGHYHDLLNDKYNGTVIRDIIRWLIERF